MKHSFLIFLILSQLINLKGQEIDLDIFLQKAKKRYEKEIKGQFTVLYKFKSSIAEDTAVSQYLCTYDGSSRLTVYNVCFESDNISLLFDGKSYYQIFNNYKSYKKYSPSQSKSLSYKMFIENLPFGFSGKFFNNLRGAILVDTNLTVKIKKGRVIYHFDPLSAALTRRISVKKTKWGDQYSEMRIQEIGKSGETDIDSLLNPSILLRGYKMLRRDEKLSKPLISKQNIGQKFPRFKVKDRDGKLFSDSILKGKFFLIDFFYESCLPCLQSIPFLNELADTTKYPNLQILAVDPILGDTVNIERFIFKNKIKYPVIDGFEAQKLWGLVRNSSYPTSLLINDKGIIVLVEDEFNKKFFRSVRKKLLQ